jgi:hypothetical protein
MATLTPEVSLAVDQLRESFPASRIDVEPDGEGGARVKVCDIDLGGKYTPQTSWCAFVIPFQYPRADVYPHFIDSSVKRADGQPFGPGIQMTTWANISAIQVSRRSNHWDPSIDTAALKLAKVLEWLRSA